MVKGCFSVRGVARRYRGVGTTLRVRETFFVGLPGISSLRLRLAIAAMEEHEFDKEECVYSWTAAYRQTWAHVKVRIHLDPDDEVLENVNLEALKNNWRIAIESKWSNRWAVARDGEGPCPLTFEVEWVDEDEHHEVEVRIGPEKSNMRLWDTMDTGDVASHEFGHMLGLADEYICKICPDRSPVDTGTVMDNESSIIPSRMMSRFAQSIGSEVVSI